MATVAHCLYCFESLAADLEKREPLTLAQVQDWWGQYNSRRGATTLVGDNHDEEYPDGMNLLEEEVVEEEENDFDEVEDDGEDEEDPRLEEGNSENEDGQLDVAAPSRSDLLRLPSISRLQNASPASTSTSSTPSTLSTTSSRAGFGDSSKSSSKTSFFSFSRRSHQSSPAPKLEEHPLFITWNTVSARSGHKSLRGCIGTFDPIELSSGLKSYALTAAFDDTRFPPITRTELPTLSASVTLLTAFTPASTPLDWTLGIHGIRISFTHHSKRYSATYLPDVAVEQGWTKEETLASLMRKAGWGGRSSEWRKVNDLKVVRYQGKKESVGYEEWRVWREWVEKRI